MKLLLFPQINEQWVRQIQAISPDIKIVNATSEEEALKEIPDADVLYGRITPKLLDVTSKLKWIQTPMAGMEHYIFPALAESNVMLTNMRGIYSDNIADHVFGYILCFARGFHTYIRRQLENRWESGEPVIHLADQTLGIIGLGGIGSEVAKRGVAFDMRVLAIDPRRTDKPEYVEALWNIGQLQDLLAQSDFVVVCAPHTPETERMIGAEQFQIMKNTAYLINISRGINVDLSALTHALQAGEIAGAGLDVFEVEPLPAEHPLWAMDNVIITPHTAGAGPYSSKRRLQVLLDNIRRFMAGTPLHNVVDKRMWY